MNGDGPAWRAANGQALTRRPGSADAFPAGVAAALSPADGKALYRCLFERCRPASSTMSGSRATCCPSEAAIGARFGVSRITVRHALQLLQIEGYIRTQRAHRAIVLAREPLLQGGYGADTIQDIIQAASHYRLAIASWGREPEPEPRASSSAASGFAAPLPAGTLMADGHRLARTIIYFHPAVGERLKLDSFGDPVVFRILQRELGGVISDVKMTVWADLADEDDAEGSAAGRAMAMSARGSSIATRKLPVEVTFSRCRGAPALFLQHRGRSRLITLR